MLIDSDRNEVCGGDLIRGGGSDHSAIHVRPERRIVYQ